MIHETIFFCFFVAFRAIAYAAYIPRPKITFSVNRPFFYVLFQTVVHRDEDSLPIYVSETSMFNGHVTKPEI